VQDVSLPAAGLPWFMTLFGRDSLITSYQVLPYRPDLAATTLTTLAARQGTVYDDFRDEEPGKILHEVRFGELTAIGERPHSPYYGTADATPLFLILLDEYERWTGDADLVGELEPAARRRAGVDRPPRRPRRGRLRRVPDAQPADRPGQPVLEGLLELDRVRRRAPRRGTDRVLRDPGLRVRRQAHARGAAGSRRLGRAPPWPTALDARRWRCASASSRTSGSPSARALRSALDGDKRRSTA
jgi:hypothetical protein